MNTLDLTTLTLTLGGHDSDSGEMCLLEAAAYQAGEPWSDRPQCVSLVLAAYGRSLNDALPDDTRQRLIPFIPRLLNTAGDGLDERRAYLALDWLSRINLPAWLRLVPALTAQADLLAAGPEVVDLSTAAASSALVRQAASQANAAQAAVWATTPATAEDATWDATWDAAWNAAGVVDDGDAAWNAAGVIDDGAAAGSVAGSAARVVAKAIAASDIAHDTARDALAPTITVLQNSAIDLFDQMLSVTK